MPTVTAYSKRGLAAAREGDLVLISFPADTERRYASHWTRYNGHLKGVDYFMKQEKSRFEQDPHVVGIYSASRDTIEFDRNLGAILGPHDTCPEFIGPSKEGFKEKVQELKEAGLWKE